MAWEVGQDGTRLGLKCILYAFEYVVSYPEALRGVVLVSISVLYVLYHGQVL